MLTVSTNSTERQMPETSFCITPARLYKPISSIPNVGDIIPMKVTGYDSQNEIIIGNDENMALNYFIRGTNYMYPNNEEKVLSKAVSGNLGKNVIAKVVAKHRNGTIELDRAQVLKQTTEILMNKISENVTATLERIVGYGAFIDIGNGVNTLLHVTNMSKSMYYAIPKHVKEGDVITVKLMDFDPKTSFFIVSRKDAYCKKEFDRGVIMVVEVNTSVNESGYFVEYDPGNVGIMDVFDDTILQEGQKVFCKVKAMKNEGFKCNFLQNYD